MKTIFTVVFALLSYVSFGQYKVTIDNGQLLAKTCDSVGIYVVADSANTFNVTLLDGAIVGCGEGDTRYADSIPIGELKLAVDCEKGKVYVRQPSTKQDVSFLLCSGKFKKGVVSCTSGNDSDGYTVADVYGIPLPRLSLNTNTPSNSRSRYLIINAGQSGHGIYSFNGTDFKESKSLDQQGSLGVLMSNKKIEEVEEVSIEIEGVQYEYEYDLSDLKGDGSTDTTDRDTTASAPADTIEAVSTSDGPLNEYLNDIFTRLDKIQYMTIGDVKVLRVFQDSLQTVTREMSLSSATRKRILDLVSWDPQYVALSEMSLAVPDADEAKIDIKIKKTGSSSENIYNVGNYRTKGGISVSVNSNLYVTNLTRNGVYTDSVDIGGTNELRAQLDTTEQISVGIGMTGEMSFRTGCMFRPIVNAGFFIPFDEDVTPYFAIGPGFSIGTGRAKLSLAGGLAVGKTNVVNSQFADRDLSGETDLTNDSLVSSKWAPGWQLNVGFSYNLGGN